MRNEPLGVDGTNDQLERLSARTKSSSSSSRILCTIVYKDWTSEASGSASSTSSSSSLSASASNGVPLPLQAQATGTDEIRDGGSSIEVSSQTTSCVVSPIVKLWEIPAAQRLKNHPHPRSASIKVFIKQPSKDDSPTPKHAAVIDKQAGAVEQIWRNELLFCQSLLTRTARSCHGADACHVAYIFGFGGSRRRHSSIRVIRSLRLSLARQLAKSSMPHAIHGSFEDESDC